MWHWLRAGVLIVSLLTPAAAQTKAPLAPRAKPVTMAELNNIAALDGQLVELTAVVRHTDTTQVFTFGAKAGDSATATSGLKTARGNPANGGEREIHVVIPNPATDAAHVGDTVALTGFVRRFSESDFERDYRWFRRTDYPDVHGGDWVIVAVSVRTPEGTELVPPATISTTPPK